MRRSNLVVIRSVPLALALLGSAVAVLMLKPVQRSPVEPPRTETLRAFLQRGPACYHWNELSSDPHRTHSGGVLFILHGERVFSAAWYTTAHSARAWPVVAGIGFTEGNTIQIAYRNATGDPAHAFYHALCRFEIDPRTRAFHCVFTQQTQAGGEPTPGAADGTLAEVAEPEFDDYLPMARSRAEAADEPVENDRCPVLSENPGKLEFEFCYQGQYFHFCCPSCMNVFKARPKSFVVRPRE